MFEKGHKKKGGREPGTPNQTTKDTREVLQMIISEELTKLPGYLAAITKPEVKAKLLIDFLPFVMPKLNSVDLKADVTSNKDFTSQLDLSKLTTEELETLLKLTEKAGNENTPRMPTIINWGDKLIKV